MKGFFNLIHYFKVKMKYVHVKHSVKFGWYLTPRFKFMSRSQVEFYERVMLKVEHLLISNLGVSQSYVIVQSNSSYLNH
jgi:hypothetical protein